MMSNNVTGRANWESLLLPAVLVAAGVLILAAANFGLVSLDRARDLWPVSIALVGLAEIFPEGGSDRGDGNE